MEKQDKLEKIKEAYGSFYETNKELIDVFGWLRISNKVTPEMGKHLRDNKHEFDSRTENHPDMYKSFVRPKSIAKLFNDSYMVDVSNFISLHEMGVTKDMGHNEVKFTRFGNLAACRAVFEILDLLDSETLEAVVSLMRSKKI